MEKFCDVIFLTFLSMMYCNGDDVTEMTS